ncbi:MAG: helix-turn-helix domain-containing protein [Endomicrobiales bacterium]|jgi:DNA-binding XRE family transcriptional regulator
MKKLKSNHLAFSDFLKEELKNPEIKKSYDEEDLYSKIAVQIGILREKQHITQQELAKRAHTTQNVVSKIESGNRNVTLKSIFRIASVFHKRVELKIV